MDKGEISRVRTQFEAGQWPQFLELVEIFGLRGWTGQQILFKFPLVAVVGENGTGKSTILKTAACAYEGTIKKESFYPSSFFVSTYWDHIQNVTLTYRVKTGASYKDFKISKLSKKWSYPENRIKRTVRFMDISRTLPLDASVGYAKIAKTATTETSTADIADEYRTSLSYILGKSYSSARFAVSDVDAKRAIGLLGRDFGEISQFHQGAGEDATLDLFRIVQSMPNYTLLIIDEIEASLHPRAQRRLIQYLLTLCRQKKLQVILSTHSPYVLEEIPPEARILLLPGTASSFNVVYGITPEFALSRIDESVHPDVNIFVEDYVAEVFLREILASDISSSELIPRINISAVGTGNVVMTLGRLAHEKKLPYPSMACIDGDYTPSPGCIVFPGNSAPEKIVYQDLKNINWEGLVDRFGIGAGTLFTVLEDAMLNSEHHEWNKMVGDKILKSAKSVWETLCNQWATKCLPSAERNRISQVIKDLIDSIND